MLLFFFLYIIWCIKSATVTPFPCFAGKNATKQLQAHFVSRTATRRKITLCTPGNGSQTELGICKYIIYSTWIYKSLDCFRSLKKTTGPTGDALLLKQMLKKQTGFVLLLKQNKSNLVFHHQNQNKSNRFSISWWKLKQIKSI